MPELASCQPAQVQAARLAWARLCHGPVHGVFGSGLLLDVRRGNEVPRPLRRLLRNGHRCGHAMDATQLSKPRTCFVTGRSTVLLHGGHRALAGVDAGRVPEKDPRLSFFARVQHVVQCGRELQECRRGGPAVLRRDVSALLRQDGVCLGRLLDQHVQRAMVHAEGDCPTAGPASRRGLMHRQEAAVSSVFMTRSSVLVHQPAQLMKSQCVLACCCSELWSSFTHLAGFLKLRRMPRNKLLLHPGEKGQKYVFL